MMPLVRALLGGLLPGHRARTRDVGGSNMIVGNVSGIVIQQVGSGPLPQPPTLLWRELRLAGGNAGRPDVFNLLTWRLRLVDTLVGRDADRKVLLDWARDGRP